MTDLAIAKLACAMVGTSESPTAMTGDTSRVGLLVENMWPLARDTMLRDHPWPDATVRRTLAKSEELTIHNGAMYSAGNSSVADLLAVGSVYRSGLLSAIVTALYTGTGTLRFALKASALVGMSNSITLATVDKAVSDLLLDALIFDEVELSITDPSYRYVRLECTVVSGTPTAGSLLCEIAPNIDDGYYAFKLPADCVYVRTEGLEPVAGFVLATDLDLVDERLPIEYTSNAIPADAWKLDMANVAAAYLASMMALAVTGDKTIVDKLELKASRYLVAAIDKIANEGRGYKTYGEHTYADDDSLPE
jgi:hypothetical protein